MDWILRILGTLCLTYGVLLLVLAALQRHLMYFPEKKMGLPDSYGLAQMQSFELTVDNLRLVGWKANPREGFPTIVYFHGNAAHLGWRAEKFRGFIDAGFGLVTISYRGYGGSQGRPSEQGLYSDARATIRFATDTLGLPIRSLILYGESMGTGVATQMATEFDIGGLVLEAPYTSVLKRSQEIYPYMPVRFVLRDRYTSIDKIGKVKAPLLILHGERDTIIPVHHGRAMLEAATSKKRGVFYPEGAHTDFNPQELGKELLSFATEHQLLR